MNFYKLHAKPNELQHHAVAHGLVPKLVWADRNKRTKEYEHIFVKDAQYAYLYAHDILKKPFPAGEAAIASLRIALRVDGRAVLWFGHPDEAEDDRDDSRGVNA